jgi:hypothetical protein
VIEPIAVESQAKMNQNIRWVHHCCSFLFKATEGSSLRKSVIEQLHYYNKSFAKR